MDNLRKIRKNLKKVLKKERYEHTLGVMYTAASMAMRYDANIEKAMLAGALHDCAKCFTLEEQIEKCEEYQILLTDFEYENPALIHPKLGIYLAKKIYKVDDTEIINAILNHTTGCPEMSILDKIIYISDFIEPTREEFPGLNEVRKLAFIDIDKALLVTLRASLNFLKKNNKKIDPMTKKTFDYYKYLTKINDN